MREHITAGVCPTTGGRSWARNRGCILDRDERRPRDRPVADADEPLAREVWIVAAVVTVGVIMSILDTTIVNVALETLSRELDAC